MGNYILKLTEVIMYSTMSSIDKQSLIHRLQEHRRSLLSSYKANTYTRNKSPKPKKEKKPISFASDMHMRLFGLLTPEQQAMFR